MVLTTVGKNKIRDAIVADIGNAQLGTSSTAPSATDTGLGTPIAATIDAVTTNTSDKQFVTTYALNSATGNGNDFKEYENTIDSTNLSRSTFAPVSKTSDIEMTVVTTYFIV